MIVDSNSAAPLQYVDATFQTSLFVRSKIYDLSGVSPVLETSVNLTLIDNGVYRSKYTFTAGKPYLVQTLVYTDGTYATVDQTFGQSVDEVQCVDLKTASFASLLTTSHFDSIIGTPTGASIAADLAEIESETDGIAAIPTTPVLTSHFDAVIGTPAGASIAADLAEIEGETDGIAALATAIAAIPTTPVLTAHFDSIIGTPANASIAADLAEIEGETDSIAAVKAKTDNLPVDPASESLVETAVATRVSTAHFDILIGTPAGASIAADLAEIEGETDVISTLETDSAAATRQTAILSAIASSSTSVNIGDLGITSLDVQEEDSIVQIGIEEEDALVQVTIQSEDTDI